MSDVCAPLNLHIGIVLLTASLVTARTEIDRHVVRDGMSKYTFVNGTQRNCLPILEPDFCAEGHQIEPCFHDKEKDRCVPCRDGEEQLDKTYSDFKPACYIHSCPEGTIPGKPDPSSGCSWPCRCESEGMVMNEDCSCHRVEVQCGSNTYLKNGVCTPCPAGTHKPGNGAGPCVTKMSPISHTSEPVTATASPASPALSASEINTTSGVQRNLIKNITGKKMTNGDLAAEENPPNHRSSNDQNMSILYITIATLLAIIVLVGLSVAIIHKLRTRKLPRHNTAQQNDSNESLMQRQVTEVGGYSRVPMRDPPPYSSQEVHMADEETQGMAQPWTKDFTDQTTGGNQADGVPPPSLEGGAEVAVHERDTDETAPKEKTTSVDQQDSNTAETLRKSNRYLDAGRGSFPSLESTEQASSVMSVTCKDADHTSIKKRYLAPSRNEQKEASSVHMGTESPLRLGSAPALNTDSFKSDHEK